jgi:hypothetical protein
MCASEEECSCPHADRACRGFDSSRSRQRTGRQNLARRYRWKVISDRVCRLAPRRRASAVPTPSQFGQRLASSRPEHQTVRSPIAAKRLKQLAKTDIAGYRFDVLRSGRFRRQPAPQSDKHFAPASTPAKSIFDLSLFVLAVTGAIFG